MSKFSGFNKVKFNKPQRSSFDLSHERRMTVKPGELVPVLCTEAVPSDKFNGSSEMLVRLAPLLAPIYDQLIVYVHFFFVPCRLLWYQWEEFITGGRLGVGIDPVTAPVPPFCDVYDADPTGGLWQKGSLADYLGVPIFPLAPDVMGDYQGTTIDIMPFMAYQWIWQEYYMDRNFNVESYSMDGQNGGDLSGAMAGGTLSALGQLRTRNYMHDYFTSSLPFTQRGEEVLIPVGTQGGYAPIVGRSNDGSITGWNYTGTLTLGAGAFTNTIEADPDAPAGAIGDFGFANLNDVQGATGLSTTINDFRSAYALQVWLERNAVGGSRYTESTQAHFGVRPQDSRLQRPEYIGGGRINVKISEVVSTAYSTNSDDDVVPLANMAGHGVSYGNTNTFNYFCTEHGFIMGILSIMNPPSYHQGLPRMFRRRSFLDYPWPTFAKLGEQQVDACEIYASSANLTEDPDDGVLPLFGYQSRYAEWKYIANTNHGDFHDTLLFWTLTRDFVSAPTLGNEFLAFDFEAGERIFAVPESDHFWLYVHNKVFVKRPLPYFGTPNTLGFV